MLSEVTGCFLAWFKDSAHNLRLVHTHFEISLTNVNWYTTVYLHRLNYLDANSIACGCHQLVSYQSTSKPKLQLVKQESYLSLCPLAFQAEVSHIMLMIVRNRAKAAKHLRTTCTLPHSVRTCFVSPVQSELSQSMWQVLQHVSCCISKKVSWRLLHPTRNECKLLHSRFHQLLTLRVVGFCLLIHSVVSISNTPAHNL